MNYVCLCSLVGSFVGAIAGFVIGAGPDIIHHFWPNVHVHGETYYIWPVGLVTAGLPAAIILVVPGAAIGAFVGVKVRFVQANWKR